LGEISPSAGVCLINRKEWPKMIRFLFLNAFIAIYTVFYCILGFFVSLSDQNGRKVHFHIAVPWAKGILAVCGIKVRTSGLENVDGTVPRIYMTNHQSYFDIFALLAHLPVHFKFIMKQELMKIPILGRTMKKAGYIGITRDEPRKAIASMNDAAEKIRNGSSVVIFPEGTRSVDGKIQPFKRGGFNLAIKSGCDIVPVTITNSYRIVPKGSLKINRGSFGLRVGKPISVKEYPKKRLPELMSRVSEVMKSQMNESGGPPASEK
jgi:1-acyl-sn-glycerol-3-phosphate acyltransferase